jgi:hypothetical protein
MQLRCGKLASTVKVTLREARTDLAKIDGDDYFEMHYSVGKDGSAVETLG